jgi:hypothetical protein
VGRNEIRVHDRYGGLVQAYIGVLHWHMKRAGSGAGRYGSKNDTCYFDRRIDTTVDDTDPAHSTPVSQRHGAAEEIAIGGKRIMAEGVRNTWGSGVVGEGGLLCPPHGANVRTANSSATWAYHD